MDFCIFWREFILKKLYLILICCFLLLSCFGSVTFADENIICEGTIDYKAKLIVGDNKIYVNDPEVWQNLCLTE